MKAVVLGATGFIGSHIARALVQEGIDVRILRRGTSPMLALQGLHLEEMKGDMEDKDSLVRGFQGCHVLFHAAGYYPIYSFEKERQKTTALRQMKNVLQAAEKAGVKKIVYTSSMSTIGNPPNPPFSKGGKGGFLANEDSPYDPKKFKGLYYETKYLLEQEAFSAASQGNPIVVVNPTGVFGDYDVKPTSGTLVVQIAKKKVPAIIDAKMNAVDARDVARGQIAAMKLGKIGRRYILGTHNTTVAEVANLIARMAKVPPPRIKLPIFLARAGAVASELAGKYLLHQEKPMLPRVGVDFLKYGMHYDTSRAEKELGFKGVPLEETFDRAIAWFRKNGYF